MRVFLLLFEDNIFVFVLFFIEKPLVEEDIFTFCVESASISELTCGGHN